MTATTANGITIEHESFGDPADEPLLLVMGLGAQLITWPVGFCEALTGRGFHVTRFDNRDVGLSSKIEDGPAPDVMAAMTGDVSSAAYTLSDMAADAAGLLDALGIESAHVVGASMGGMIAQTMAIEHPARVRSLCSIMSTTGDPAAGPPSPDALTVLLRPPASTRDEAIANSVEAGKVIGSTAFPTSDEERVDRAAAAYDRCFYPVGIARQLVAVQASGDRTERLRALDVPTVVIHGTVDPLVQPAGGELTTKAIPGAGLLLVEGMGHDLPEGVWPTVIDAICANAARAR